MPWHTGILFEDNDILVMMSMPMASNRIFHVTVKYIHPTQKVEIRRVVVWGQPRQKV
jgi:hypothetical protein